MGKSSSAYVSCVVAGKTYTYHFTGVTAIEHNLALNLNNKASQGTDIVNGARNLANQVTLSVIETDAEHPAGWAARMLEAMDALKKQRVLCKVVTSMAAYEQMLLTEITATQDEENQFGWSGTLAFVEYTDEAFRQYVLQKLKLWAWDGTNEGVPAALPEGVTETDNQDGTVTVSPAGTGVDLLPIPAGVRMT